MFIILIFVIISVLATPLIALLFTEKNSYGDLMEVTLEAGLGGGSAGFLLGFLFLLFFYLFESLSGMGRHLEEIFSGDIHGQLISAGWAYLLVASSTLYGAVLLPYLIRLKVGGRFGIKTVVLGVLFGIFGGLFGGILASMLHASV